MRPFLPIFFMHTYTYSDSKIFLKPLHTPTHHLFLPIFDYNTDNDRDLYSIFKGFIRPVHFTTDGNSVQTERASRRVEGAVSRKTAEKAMQKKVYVSHYRYRMSAFTALA